MDLPFLLHTYETSLCRVINPHRSTTHLLQARVLRHEISYPRYDKMHHQVFKNAVMSPEPHPKILVELSRYIAAASRGGRTIDDER